MEKEKDYIYINSEWRIDRDNLNLILQRKNITKVKDKATKEVIETKETWSTFGYYGTYKEVLRDLVNQEVMQVATLEGLVDKIEELHNMIENLDIPRR